MANPTTNFIAWDVVLKQAFVLAAALIGYSALLYVLDVNTMSTGVGLVNFVVTIALCTGIALMTIRYHAAQNEGAIRFGRAFTVGLIVAVIGIFISGFWSYILVKFIDPDYLVRMKEQFLEQVGESIPADRMEEAVAGFDRMASLSGTAWWSAIAALIFGAISALIAAAIGKKSPSTGVA